MNTHNGDEESGRPSWEHILEVILSITLTAMLKGGEISKTSYLSAFLNLRKQDNAQAFSTLVVHYRDYIK